MKDNFSTHSGEYARFRPDYPAELYQYLFEHLSAREIAWDCGTGNGQMARVLARGFSLVEATDISGKQLTYAMNAPNIKYTIQQAEKTIFPSEHFDLVTVAQAIHWFDFQRFYQEVHRVLKPGGLIAVIGYGLVQGPEACKPVIDHLYHELVGPYWDEERRYLDEEYKTIPFPFQELSAPELKISVTWTLERLVGYLKTWSAVKHYEKAKGQNPVDLIAEDLEHSFGAKNGLNFPIFTRIGKNS